jgi:hypothetical protein
MPNPPKRLSRDIEMKVTVPEFGDNLDSVIYPFFSRIFGKRGTVTVSDSEGNVIHAIEFKKTLKKSLGYADFRLKFLKDEDYANEDEFIISPDMVLSFTAFKEVKPKKLKQQFREGVEHCVFTPLLKVWSERPSKHQETMLKKVQKYATHYGDNPVPQEEMEGLAKKLRTTIKINDPIGNPYITYNAKADRTCVVENSKKNHVEEAVEEKPILPITHAEAIEFLKTLKDGEVLEGTFRDPIRIHSFKEVYEVPNPILPYLEEINKLIPDVKFDASMYPEINEFILESRIINSGTLRFQEEYDEHYDLETAYAQFHLTPYYRGFLGVIHQWRNFTFPPTMEFLKQHNGIYKAKIIKPSRLAKMLGLKKDNYYILILPEWLFHKDTGTEFIIVSGIYGSSFDFRFPESSFKTVPLRNYNPDAPKKTSNKPFRIFAGQLSSKLNEHDKKTYCVKSTEEFAEHLKTLYPDVEYDEERQIARINIEHKKVYTRHHVLSFITGYTRIVMMQEMMKFDISKLSGITLDGLYFKGKPPKDLIPQFRPKESKMGTNSSTLWYIPTENNTQFPLWKNEFNTNTFLEGAGGSGKTHRILKDEGFNNILYASPTHDLGKDKVAEYEITRYTTIHRLAGLDPQNAPIQSYSDIYGTPPVILIDEITQIEAKFIDRIIEMYPNSLLLIAGDVDKDGRHFQCKYKNEIWKPTFPIVEFITDYRAKTEKLKEIKYNLRNYMKTDPTTDEIKTYVYSNFSVISKEEAMTRFKPEDVWIAGTHRYIKTLAPRKIHTTHSYQGKTIPNPTKLFISIEDMFEHTMFYTALSRVEDESQIIIVGK